MKVFADATETSFFRTENHVKNLHEVEINSIEDFVFRYALDSDILLGIKCWMVRRFDELLPGTPCLDRSDEPELRGEWLDIDFIADMTLLDILSEIAKFDNISHCMEDIKNSGVFQSIQNEWINEDNDEKWTIKAWNDSRTLEVIIDAEDNVITRMTEDEL